MTMHPELERVLQQIQLDLSTSELVRNYLSITSQLESLAAAIQGGATKSEFIALQSMSEDVYLELRSKLNKKQVGNVAIITAVRGASGGLKLVQNSQGGVNPKQEQVQQEEQFADEAERVDVTERTLERSYYPLVKAWAEVAGNENCKITGGLIPGHSWENPDLVSISGSISELSRSLKFYTVSFEVKLLVHPFAVWQAAH
jgi:hypothetical protein